jgi:hypothetical protein
VAGVAADWGQLEELVASVIDVLVAVNSSKRQSWSYPRPGVEDERVRRFKSRRPASSSAELRARLAAKWAIGDAEAGEGVSS